MKQNDGGREDPIERLKKINYIGCSVFYDGLNGLKVLETLDPMVWVDNLHRIQDAERKYIAKKPNYTYLALEKILRERPEEVYYLCQSIFDNEVLKKNKKLCDQVKAMVRGLLDNLFYTDEANPPGFIKSDKDKRLNLIINEPRIKMLEEWALQMLRNSAVITYADANQVEAARGKSALFGILHEKISEVWEKLLHFIRVELQMEDLARCLEMPPSNTIRSEAEISTICLHIPPLPKNFFRRATYCEQLERAVDDWDNSGKLMLSGAKDTGLTTLAIYGAWYAVKHRKVDRVVSMECSGCHQHLKQTLREIRTLYLLSSPCCNIWRSACFAIVTSNTEISQFGDFKEICVKEAFTKEDCLALLSRSLRKDKETHSDLFCLTDQFLEDPAHKMVAIIPNRMSALCEAVDALKRHVLENCNGNENDMNARFMDFDMDDWLQKRDNQNVTPTYWNGLKEELKKCYCKLILFCETETTTEARICVHSMTPIWNASEKHTRGRLLDYENKLLLRKGSMHDGCQTYRLNGREDFLRSEMKGKEAELRQMKEDLVARYERHNPDVQDEFYFSQIVRLLVETDQAKKAIALLTSFKFKDRRVASGTLGNFLHDFQLVSKSSDCTKKLHLHWAMAEVEVPTILVSDGGHVRNNCAGLHLIKAPTANNPNASRASLRLHARHRFEDCPFLPKLRSGWVRRRSSEGHMAAFPQGEFFTYLDRSPDCKLVVLCSNFSFIYLVDSCSFDVVDRFDVKVHVFFVHFLSNDRFFAVANDQLHYFTIAKGRTIVETKKLGMDAWGLISDKICEQSNNAATMTVDSFVRPVALHGSTLWVGKEDGVYVYSCEETAKQLGKFLLTEDPREEASFVAVCNREEVQLAADCRQKSLRVLFFSETTKDVDLHLTHKEKHEVRAAAWLKNQLVFSTAAPAVAIGTVDLDKPDFPITHRLDISFSPNFALSHPTAPHVLFGEVSGRVAMFGARLDEERPLPLRKPHALIVPSGKDCAGQLMGAFDPQRVELLEWPDSKDRGFVSVPAAVPIALTESKYTWFFQKWHEPNFVLKVCAVGSEDVAIVVRKQKVTFVRLRDTRHLMQHRWPADKGDLKQALCEVDLVDGRILAVIATRECCFRYHVHEKRSEDLDSLPRNRTGGKYYFESLVLHGEKLLCSASCTEDKKNFSIFTYEKEWKDVTGNNAIAADRPVFLKDEQNVELLLLLPNIHDVQCILFDVQEQQIRPPFIDASKPIIFDVSPQANRLAIVRQNRVVVYEFKAGNMEEVREMQFEGKAFIHAVSFVPDNDNLLSIVFAANAFSDLKLCVWDIAGRGDKDVFEIDIRNAITSFNFFEEQQPNSKLFWSMKKETALFLTERSLVKIDLKSLESNLELDSDWFFGSQGHCFDVHKSFVSDENIYLVLDNAEMFWFQRR